MKKVQIQKVDLRGLIEHLIEMYETGVDYTDVIAISQPGQDVLSFVVKDEYISEERKELTEEDINDLIDG